MLRSNGTGLDYSGVVYDNGTAVGIGTASPGYPLDLQGNTTDRVRLNIQNNNSTSKSSLLQLNGAGVWLIGTDSGLNGTNDLFIFGGNAFRLTVLGSNGYVGIGTQTPSYPLHVNGTAYASTMVTGDIAFTDKVCAKCGREFKVDDDLKLKLTKVEKNMIRTVPVHVRCRKRRKN
jgi:hypothetical protein